MFTKLNKSLQNIKRNIPIGIICIIISAIIGFASIKYFSAASILYLMFRIIDIYNFNLSIIGILLSALLGTYGCLKITNDVDNYK